MVRGPRLAGAVVLALVALALVPSGASAAVEILGRGIAPDPAVANGKATLTVDVSVGLAPYIVEFFCCDPANIDTPAQSKFLLDNSPETQGLKGTHTFEFNVGPAGVGRADGHGTCDRLQR